MSPIISRPMRLASNFTGTLDPDSEVAVGVWRDDTDTLCSGAAVCEDDVADASDSTFVQTEIINTMAGCASAEIRDIRFGMDNPSPLPRGGETVVLTVRARYTTAGSNGDVGEMRVRLYEGGNEVKLWPTSGWTSLTTSWADYAETLSTQTKRDMLGKWNDARVDVEIRLCEEDGADMRGQIAKIDIDFS